MAKKEDRQPGVEQLETIRRAITAKLAELEEIDHTALSQVETFERVDQFLAWETENIRDRYFKALSFMHHASPFSSVGDAMKNMTPVELEVWLHPEALNATLRKLAEGHWQKHGHGLSTGERTAKVTELETALAALYRQEEEIFIQLKAAGLEPSRRGDEPVEVVYEVVLTQ